MVYENGKDRINILKPKKLFKIKSKCNLPQRAQRKMPIQRPQRVYFLVVFVLNFVCFVLTCISFL